MIVVSLVCPSEDVIEKLMEYIIDSTRLAPFFIFFLRNKFGVYIFVKVF